MKRLRRVMVQQLPHPAEGKSDIFRLGGDLSHSEVIDVVKFEIVHVPDTRYANRVAAVWFVVEDRFDDEKVKDTYVTTVADTEPFGGPWHYLASTQGQYLTDTLHLIGRGGVIDNLRASYRQGATDGW